MAYECRILADSLSPNGVRLTTFEVKFPRFILAEVNTHSMLSRSAQSSRAIPVELRIEEVLRDPVIPVEWGKNRRGMQATEVLEEEAASAELADWLHLRDEAVKVARRAVERKTHKQIANRYLELWAWVKVVITATEWDNFFALRTHPDAQPEFQVIARMMRDAYSGSAPVERCLHVPYVAEPVSQQMGVVYGDSGTRVHAETRQFLMELSAARCARVSYRGFDGTTSEFADVALAGGLLRKGHMGPFEHQAVSSVHHDPEEFSGKLRGWTCHRKLIPGEAVWTPPDTRSA